MIQAVDLAFENALQAHPLSEEDVLNSDTAMGMLAYRIPSPMNLTGWNADTFDIYPNMTYILKVKVGNDTLECRNEDLCKIMFYREYTPLIYKVVPQVLTMDDIVDIWIDPKSTLNIVRNLRLDEKFFVNAKIGNSLVDFEGNIENTFKSPNNTKRIIRGKVTDDIPRNVFGYPISMLWEAGKAIKTSDAKHCSIPMGPFSTCYETKTVPVITSISNSSGWISGGQNLTIYGHRLNDTEVNVRIGDYGSSSCYISYRDDSKIHCTILKNATISDYGLADGRYRGSRGVARQYYNSSSRLELWRLSDDQYTAMTPVTRLATTFAAPHTKDEFNIYTFKGLFDSPGSFKYRFWMTCNDQCDLKLGPTGSQVTMNSTYPW